MILSLWNLTGISATLLGANCKAIGKFKTRISWLRHFTRSCGKTFYRLGPMVVGVLAPFIAMSLVISIMWDVCNIVSMHFNYCHIKLFRNHKRKSILILTQRNAAQRELNTPTINLPPALAKCWMIEYQLNEQNWYVFMLISCIQYCTELLHREKFVLCSLPFLFFKMSSVYSNTIVS